MIDNIISNKTNFLTYFCLVGGIKFVREHNKTYIIELTSGMVEVITDKEIAEWWDILNYA